MGFAGADYLAHPKRRTTTRGGLKRRDPGFQTRDEGPGPRTWQRSAEASTSTATSRRKKPMVSAYGSSRKYAYKRTRLTRQVRQPKALIPYVIERLQGVNMEQPDTDPTTGTFFPGYYVIYKGESGSTTSGLTMPVMIFDLTRMNNTAAGVSGCGYKLLLGDAGNAAFTPVNSQLATGSSTTNATYYMENQQNFNGAPQSCHHFQNAWYDIRFKCYGARKQSVTYDIHLVRFNHPSLIPDQLATDTVWSSRRTQFWQSVGKSYTVNSILPDSYSWKKYVTFVKSKRIVLPASTSDDLDRNAESVDFKWFVKDMRMRDYRVPTAFHVSDGAVDSPGWPVTGFTGVSDDPKPSQRLFVLVCATDMTSFNPVGAHDQDDSPSFDLFIRRKAYAYGTA